MLMISLSSPMRLLTLSRPLASIRFRCFSSSTASSSSILIQPAQLAALMATSTPSNKVVVVDCTGPAAPGSPAIYIPGAVSLAEAASLFNSWVALKGPDRMHVVPRKQFIDIADALGIDAKTTVVAYDGLQNQMASRFFWVASLYGFPQGQVKVLDGGLTSWRKAALNTSIEPEDPETASASAPISLLREQPELLTSLKDVTACVKSKSSSILDVRSSAEFNGMKNMNTRPGRVPGALPLEWINLLDQDTNCLLPPAKLREKFVRAGVLPIIPPRDPSSAKPVVVYCQSGARASVGFLALRSLGVRASMYDASMGEWANLDSTALEL